MSGSFEGETVTRRRLMTSTAHIGAAAATAAVVLPALGFAAGPIFDRTPLTWQDVGSLSSVPDSTYLPVTITITTGIGEAGKSIAYLRRHRAALDGRLKDDYDRVIAISSRCAHVGCPVNYVAAAKRFICPCHGGVYDFRGIRESGQAFLAPRSRREPGRTRPLPLPLAP
jgi:Rieske Fe-S protein